MVGQDRVRVGDRRSIAGRMTVLAVAGLIGILPGCAPKHVSRIDPNSVTDLSGSWNDTDSRLVAKALIEQSLGDGWAERYASDHGGNPPTVIVGGFRNDSYEHIPVGDVRERPRAGVRRLGPGAGRRRSRGAAGGPRGAQGPAGQRPRRHARARWPRSSAPTTCSRGRSSRSRTRRAARRSSTTRSTPPSSTSQSQRQGVDGPAPNQEVHRAQAVRVLTRGTA